MRKSKFSEHQIIAILKAGEAGRTVRAVCREHEISDATYISGSQSTVEWKKRLSPRSSTASAQKDRSWRPVHHPGSPCSGF